MNWVWVWDAFNAFKQSPQVVPSGCSVTLIKYGSGEGAWSEI
jgi:hypothetical protein